MTAVIVAFILGAAAIAIGDFFLMMDRQHWIEADLFELDEEKETSLP